MPTYPRLILLMLFCVIPARSAWATAHQTELHAYMGTAYAAEGFRALFTEHHLLRGDPAAPAQRLVLYRCNDGRAFARKLVEHGEHAYAPSYRFHDARGYAEGIQRDPEGELLAYTGTAQTLRAIAPAGGDELVVDAGFDRFIRNRWEALAEGQPVPLLFAVASRGQTLDLRLRKVSGSEPGSAGERRFRLAPAGLLRLLLPPIEVDYSETDRWLARFNGITGIRGDEGDNLSARIEFPQRPAPVPADSWQRWLDEPLQRCPIG